MPKYYRGHKCDYCSKPIDESYATKALIDSCGNLRIRIIHKEHDISDFLRTFSTGGVATFSSIRLSKRYKKKELSHKCR